MRDFQQVQQAFIAHIKDPENCDFEHDIEDRRLAIYRDLFFNNVLGFLSSGFPVLESLYNETQWKALARQFFAQHHCRSPYFVDISKEFVEYVCNEYELQEHDPVFMQELAHYEWVELDISVRKIAANVSYGSDIIDLRHVYMSPLADLVSYQFPVHNISKDFQPTETTDPTYLVVYRNEQDEVNFSKVNAVTAHLLNLISSHSDLSILVELMQQALPQLNPADVEQSTHQILSDLMRQKILCI